MNAGERNIRLLVNQSGRLAEQSPIAVGTEVLSLAVGDLNGDERADIVVGASERLIVLLSEDNGNFRAIDEHVAGWQPTAIALGDFNQAGRMDVAAADTARSRAGVWLGDGKSALLAGASWEAGHAPVALVAADFDGDGRMDLAVAGASSHDVSLFLGRGGRDTRPALDHRRGLGIQSPSGR